MLVPLLLLPAPGAQELQERMENALAAGDPFVVPVFVVGETWRVATEPRGLGARPGALLELITRFVERAAIIQPAGEYRAILWEMLSTDQPRGAEVFDYQIAALCIEHHVPRIWSFDQRFPVGAGLDVVDPSR